MSVQSFDSLEQMQAAMAAAETTANASLTPTQIALRDDVNNVRHWVAPGPGFIVFGRTHTWRRVADDAARYVPNQHDPEHSEGLDEAVYSIRATAAARARGYLFGDAFSAPFPDAELGDTHVSTVTPITEAAFNEARRCGWRLVEADRLAALMVPAEELARRTTPTLIAELRAAGVLG